MDSNTVWVNVNKKVVEEKTRIKQLQASIKCLETKLQIIEGKKEVRAEVEIKEKQLENFRNEYKRANEESINVLRNANEVQKMHLCSIVQECEEMKAKIIKTQDEMCQLDESRQQFLKNRTEQILSQDPRYSQYKESCMQIEQKAQNVEHLMTEKRKLLQQQKNNTEHRNKYVLELVQRMVKHTELVTKQQELDNINKQIAELTPLFLEVMQNSSTVTTAAVEENQPDVNTWMDEPAVPILASQPSQKGASQPMLTQVSLETTGNQNQSFGFDFAKPVSNGIIKSINTSSINVLQNVCVASATNEECTKKRKVELAAMPDMRKVQNDGQINTQEIAFNAIESYIENMPVLSPMTSPSGENGFSFNANMDNDVFCFGGNSDASEHESETFDFFKF